MVAVLTKYLSAGNMELAEDVVQDTLFKALQIWKIKGVPDNPTAWLYRVAKNRLVDLLRKRKFETSLDPFLTSEYLLPFALDGQWEEPLIEDNLLVMMYVCCHPEISLESQICLILKNLCGLSVAEIASALMTGQETIAKRLQRARQFLKEKNISFNIPDKSEIEARTTVVLKALYLLFNEGYKSFNHKEHIRPDLIRDAISLCKMIERNPLSHSSEVLALLALMCFHVSREQARMSDDGRVLLLHEQDRGRWDADLISQGITYLQQASSGDRLSDYHLEAIIAYEHCTALSLEATNWENILLCYNKLHERSDNDVILLNRCIVYTKLNGNEAGLIELKMHEHRLTSIDLFHHFLGTIYEQKGDKIKAVAAYSQAMALSQNQHEKNILLSRLDGMNA